MRLLKLFRLMIKGSLKTAIRDGMRVEEGVTVMGGVSFGSEPYLISLRKRCRISSNVLFITHDGGTWAFRNHYDGFDNIIKYGSIEVGEEAFIGANSTIMPGVKIGHHSVVGAGSVVTKSIPAETVWAGVPARQVCTLREYAEKSRAVSPECFNKTEYDKDKKAYLINLMNKGEI